VRVAHFCDSEPGRIDGVSRSAGLAVSLLRDAGHEVHHYFPGAVPSIPVPFRRIRVAAPWIRPRPPSRPDIVHVHTTGPIGLAGFDLAARDGIPLVVTWHTDLVAYADHFAEIPIGAAYCAWRLGLGWSPGQYWELAGARRRERLVQLGRAMMARVAVVIAPSGKTAAALAEFGVVSGVRVLPTPVSLPVHGGCYGALPHRARAGHSAGVRAALRVPPSAPVVLAVGRTTPEKNPGLLLDAVALLGREAYLVVVGAGQNRRWLRRRVAALGLTDRVRLVKPVPHASLPAYYAMADVVAFASTTDTQSLVVAEAEAMGVPVVSVDAALSPAYRMTCPPTASGLASGLTRMLSDAGARERCVRAGLRATAEYPPARFLDGLVEAYESVM